MEYYDDEPQEPTIVPSFAVHLIYLLMLLVFVHIAMAL